MLGNSCQFFIFVLRNLASLCAGANLLLTTGLIGIFVLPVFMRALSTGALGCIWVKYPCVFYQLVVCKILLFYEFVLGI